MKKRPILTVLFASLVFVITLSIGVTNNTDVQTVLFGAKPEVLQGNIFSQIMRINPDAYSPDFGESVVLSDDVVMGKYGEWSYCQYNYPTDLDYSADLISVDVDEYIEPGSVFMVDMTFQNTGNVRLFSEDSECFGKPSFNVGTQMSQDRESIFGTEEYAIAGWENAERIKMSEPYADPEEEFHVIFQSIAPEGDNIYREFFQAVVEGVGWLEDEEGDGMFIFDIEVGEPTEQMYDDIQYVTSTALDAGTLSGLERNLLIDLSTQIMYVKMGDYTVWTMEVSSGAYDTPTPPGEYAIFQKQELRIGGEYPHYRMPYWQYWDARGYGIHALPYLESDEGTFWQEANDHIGIPVSHGCIRTLPDDAEKLYQYTIIGTPLSVVSSL